MASDVDRIAEVLNAHSLWGEILVCECERWHWDAEVDNDPYSGHAKHQAEQLAAAGIGHVPTALHQAADDFDRQSNDYIEPAARFEGYYAGALSAIRNDAEQLRNRADAVTEAKP